MFNKLKAWLGLSEPSSQAKQEGNGDVKRIRKEVADALKSYGEQQKQQRDERLKLPTSGERIEYEANRKTFTTTLIHTLELHRARVESLEPSEDRDVFLGQLGEMIARWHKSLIEQNEMLESHYKNVAVEAKLHASIQNIKKLEDELERVPYEDAKAVYELARKHDLDPIALLKDFASKSKGQYDYERDIKPFLPLLKRDWEKMAKPMKGGMKPIKREGTVDYKKKLN